MMKFEPHTFGDLNVHDYDETQNPATTGATVEFISDLAGQGRILELASGTGRITVPLAQRGHDICGIEGSDKMVNVMRAKPGGADIPVREKQTVPPWPGLTVPGRGFSGREQGIRDDTPTRENLPRGGKMGCTV